ncbi:MAG: pentapeptide repeat-containing protein [Methylocella sp.]
MQFEIRNRWSGDVQFTAEIECADDALISIKVGLAVKWGVSNRANLDGANLDGASLIGANLDGANLRGASLDGANLDGVNLRDASLDGASLRGANLDGASLDGVNLRGASLIGANLRSVRADLYDILLRAIPEVPALLTALREGRVNGSTYEGECACLVGTIANVRQVYYDTLGLADSSRPVERWFLGINKGDTPENSQIAKITEGMIVEFMDLVGLNSTVVAESAVQS